MRGLVEGGPDGGRERFVGWLALLAALERLFNESAVARPSPVSLRSRSTK